MDSSVLTEPSAVFLHRAQGALVGMAVGDALGAPFEFRPPGNFLLRFPRPVVGGIGEMVGGGPWEPGEFTDDTQMALLLSDSLLEHDGAEPADAFARFQRWVASGPKDVGTSTRAVLTSGLPWQSAAKAYYQANPDGAAGNGSLMRALPAAIFFARKGREATLRAARAISALTHGDPAAGDGCAIYHELVLAALAGRNPLAAVHEAITAIPQRRRRAFAVMLTAGWSPAKRGSGNGTIWGALATAVWAIRKGGTFHDILVRAIDQGGDADTVGAITGGLAGAMFGLGAIPSRWATYVHGEVLGRRYGLDQIRGVARQLAGASFVPIGPFEPALGPKEVDDGLWVANLLGAASADPTFAVISLCRTDRTFASFPVRRELFLIDRGGAAGTEEDENPAIRDVLQDVFASIDAFRAEGRQVLIHCFAGRSRTGFFFRAWLRRTRGLSVAEATREAIRLWPETTTSNSRFEEILESMVIDDRMPPIG